MNQLTKLSINGKAVGDCPDCQAEDTMFIVFAMKWTKEKQWQHIAVCDACGFEQLPTEGN